MKLVWISVTYLALVNAVQVPYVPQKSLRGEEYLNSIRDNNNVIPLSDNIIEDSKLDVVGLIKKYGYPVDVHEVTTEDGYQLAVHRIPAGKNGVRSSDKIPVFLMHGMLMSSVDWVINGPGKGLAYILADLGYDVWMGNARGNYYSRKHVTMDPDKDGKFWNFSWNEIGLYDLPAMLDYILEQVDKPALHYIGHSQGTTTFFVMASQKPEYNAKIKSMNAMGPAAYMGYLLSPLVRMWAPWSLVMEYMTSLFGANEFLPTNEFMSVAAHLLCGEGSVMIPVCTSSLFLLAGYNPDQLNTTMLPLYMSHTPAGASSMQMIHYCQEHMSKRFRKYDHGYLTNQKLYGTGVPPSYDLGKITAPVALHYSDNDWLVAVVDVNRLNKELSNVIGMFRVPMKEFNHLDFMWGIDAPTLVYAKIINVIKALD